MRFTLIFEDYIQLILIFIMKLFIILLSTIVFLLVVINLFVSLVIFLGEDYHVIDQIKIYELFQEQPYRKVRSALMHNNYTILVGDDDSGVKNFIEHQANLQTLEGRNVVIKNYQSESASKQKLRKKFKQTRFYIELALGLEREERTQVFLVNEESQIPVQEVQFIKKKYPNDNIIIICPKTVKIDLQGFKRIVFPVVSEKLIKHTLHSYYHIDSEAADRIFQKYNNSIQKIFDYFKRKAKAEDVTAEEFIQIQQLQEMNQLSHQMALQENKKRNSQAKEAKNKQKRSKNKNKAIKTIQ